MKYIKLFEAKKHEDKIKDFIPEEYIIFEYGATNPGDEFNNFRSLIFGKINKVSSRIEKDYFLFALVIDFVDMTGVNYEWIKNDVIRSFNIQLVNTLYTSASKKDVQEKYIILAEEYEARKDAKKYNL